MRLLLTADLHCRLPWFKWLEAQALRYEAVIISGDLLDVFHKEPLKQQVKRTTSWLRSLAAKTNVVLCSGNHDTIDIPFERGLCPMPEWVKKIEAGHLDLYKRDLRLIAGASGVLRRLI
jgi:DNA repair exonuclease SbcCD nuclease subunit